MLSISITPAEDSLAISLTITNVCTFDTISFRGTYSKDVLPCVEMMHVKNIHSNDFYGSKRLKTDKMYILKINYSSNKTALRMRKLFMY